MLGKSVPNPDNQVYAVALALSVHTLRWSPCYCTARLKKHTTGKADMLLATAFTDAMVSPGGELPCRTHRKTAATKRKVHSLATLRSRFLALGRLLKAPDQPLAT